MWLQGRTVLQTLAKVTPSYSVSVSQPLFVPETKYMALLLNKEEIYFGSRLIEAPVHSGLAPGQDGMAQGPGGGAARGMVDGKQRT